MLRKLTDTKAQRLCSAMKKTGITAEHGQQLVQHQGRVIRNSYLGIAFGVPTSRPESPKPNLSITCT